MAMGNKIESFSFAGRPQFHYGQVAASTTNGILFSPPTAFALALYLFQVTCRGNQTATLRGTIGGSVVDLFAWEGSSWALPAIKSPIQKRPLLVLDVGTDLLMTTTTGDITDWIAHLEMVKPRGT